MENRTIRLRPLKAEDAPDMLQWMCDADTVRFLAIGQRRYTLADAQRFITDAGDESANLHRAITDAAGAYLGTVSLKNIDTARGEAEFAIALSARARGTGAALQAAKAILHIAFDELGLQRVYLNVLEKNRRAVRYYEKLAAIGLRYEKQTELTFAGDPEPLLWYDVTRQDFAAVQADAL